MKPEKISIWIVFAFILLLIATACSSPDIQQEAAPKPEILHFENEIVAFDYRSDVKIFSGDDPEFVTEPYFSRLGGNLTVGLAKQEWMNRDIGTLTCSIGVFRHRLPPGSSLEDVMKAEYAAAYAEEAPPGELPEQSGPIIIDGLSAIRRTYRVYSGPYSYILQDIWLEKEGTVFRLSFWSQGYPAYIQEVADMFLETLEIKDNLPPFIEKPTPTPTPTPTPYPAALLSHYEDSRVAFDYPTGMTIFQPGDALSTSYPDFNLGGDLLIGVGDPVQLHFEKYHRSIRIHRLALKDATLFELQYLDAYVPIEKKYSPGPGLLTLPGKISIGGWDALQKTYRIYSGEPAYELRDIWLPKGKEVFIISIYTIYTSPEDFSLFQSGADAFINSLILK